MGQTMSSVDTDCDSEGLQANFDSYCESQH